MAVLKHDGKLIVMAFPDTFVRMSGEWLCRFLPLVGLGTRDYIKAGHAALILIDNKTGSARYFDFGRYITPAGHGRVRSLTTDVELEIPFKAKLDQTGALKNTEEFLLWLEANPDKTHGQGRMLASVCDKIDYQKAEDYILNLQNRGSIPYGAFVKGGSNCSRFVTETLLASTSDSKIIKRLKWNKKFTPSTVGNVEKAATESDVFQVYNGELTRFNGSAFKENLRNYFHKKRNGSEVLSKMKPPSENAQFLSGIGSSAWFELQSNEDLAASDFIIKRFDEHQRLDFSGVFKADKPLDMQQPYAFIYDSHCAKCTLSQNGHQIELNFKERLPS